MSKATEGLAVRLVAVEAEAAGVVAVGVRTDVGACGRDIPESFGAVVSEAGEQETSNAHTAASTP